MATTRSSGHNRVALWHEERVVGLVSRTNVLEFTTGTASGSYSNNFAPTSQTNVLSGGSGVGTITNMVDVGGATNRPSRYYRVRVLVP